MLEDIIILHMRTKNYDQAMCGSWDLVHDRYNYFSFWTIFCPFIPLIARKIKIKKNGKKGLEISSFYKCVLKIIIRSCMVPEIWRVTDVIVTSHFWANFCPFTPLNTKKSKFKKNEKEAWTYHHFTYV